MVREQSLTQIDPRTVEGGKPPADDAGALEWLVGGGPILLDAVAADPSVPVWTAIGPRPASWWIRRRLHESTVHRADAAIAVGAPYSLAADVAADGVTEWVELLVAEGARPLADGVSLHLHATDVDAEWTLRGTPEGLSFEPAHTKATAALRGPATDLLLAITRRRALPDTDLTPFGDESVWPAWLANTPF